MRHSLVRMATAVLVAALACKSDAPAPATSGCDAGFSNTNGTCVADYFLEAEFPLRTGLAFDTDPDAGTFVSGTLFILFKDAGTSKASATATLAGYGGTVNGSFPRAGVYRASFGGASSLAQLQALETTLAADPAILFSVRDGVDNKLANSDAGRPITDLEVLENQGRDTWAYNKIKLYEAWDAIYTANPKMSPVVVGILDGHLSSTRYGTVPFVNQVDHRSEVPYDAGDTLTLDHAANVAAIIGAPNNTSETCGVVSGLGCIKYYFSPQTVSADWQLIVDGGISKERMRTSFSLMFVGLIQALRAGARVVNVSMGATPASAVMTQRFRQLYSALFSIAPWAVFVLAAGNENSDAVLHIPSSAAANSDNAISVAASDSADARWTATNNPDGGGSNHDSDAFGTVTIHAPGKYVLTEDREGYVVGMTGTSAAAPVVSGVAALAFAMNPALTGAEVRSLIATNSDTISVSAAGKTYSTPRLNAKKVVDAVISGLPRERRKRGTCRDAGPCPDYFQTLDEFYVQTIIVPQQGGSFSLRFNKKPDLATIISSAYDKTADTVKLKYTGGGWPTGTMFPLKSYLVSDAGERVVRFETYDTTVTIGDTGKYTVYVEGGNASNDGVNDTNKVYGIESDDACGPVLFFDQLGQGSAHAGGENLEFSFECDAGPVTWSGRYQVCSFL